MEALNLSHRSPVLLDPLVMREVRVVVDGIVFVAHHLGENGVIAGEAAHEHEFQYTTAGLHPELVAQTITVHADHDIGASSETELKV